MAVSSALGGAVRRREDPRLVTGAGQYTDDVRRPGSLHAVFVRSTLAHARIRSVDISEAAAMPGVVGAFLASDLGLKPRAQFPAPDTMARPPLATGVVRFVGDMIAVVVSSTQAEAIDAAGAVAVDYDPLVAVVDAAAALAPGATILHPDKQDNLAFAVDKVRVVTPDVGGGFGAKLATYREHSVVGALALKLGRPVRWLEYRSESMVAMTQGRAQIQHVSLGALRDGTLVGLEVELIGDAGAYPAIGAYLPLLTAQMACGVYDLPKARVRARAASTNTSVIAAYRGAGRPEATALIERAIDMLADELGIDPAELRRRNLITSPFPHDTPTGVTYDSGDYVRALDVALETAGYEQLRREQDVRRTRGDRLQLGIGISSYVEVTAGGTPMEHGAVRVDADGMVTVHAGTTSSGQGHETAFAQLAAALLDVPMESVRVIESDTGVVKSGDGSYFSRSLQLGGSAVRGACLLVIEKAREEAARQLEANLDDIVHIEGGRFGVRGVPASSLGWPDLASEAVLAAEEDFIQTDQTFPFGCHIAVVEVDIETGEARLVRHVAVDDCGTILNPMLVEGQIHGGVAQGVGQALYEEFVYDSDGNPLTASLVDYAIPSIGEIPFIETLHTETPSPHNPLGAKGVGESGTIGSTPAVQNAVIDAVSHLGVRHIDMPCHPMRVWEAIQAAVQAKAATAP